MKYKKLLIIVLTLFIVQNVVFAYDTTFNETIGTNSLPQEGMFSINLSLGDNGYNETFYFNITSKSDRLQVDVPSNKLLNNTNIFELPIEWSVEDDIFTSNTTLESEIMVTNSLNSKNYSVGVVIDVIKEEKGVFSIISTSKDAVYKNGMYVRNVSILDFPGDGDLFFNINGSAGEVISLSGCDDDWFLACKDNTYTLNKNGYLQLKVPYRLEFTPLGVYNESFKIEWSDNRSNTIKVQFNVLQPRFEMNFDMIEDCEDYENLTFSAQMNCSARLLKYQAEGIIQLNEYFSKVNTENICKQFIKPEYVVGDSISKEVLDRNAELNTQLLQCNKEKVACDTNLVSCERQNNAIMKAKDELSLSFQSQLNDKENDNTKKLLNQSAEHKKLEEEQKNRMLFWLKIITFTISMICFAYLGILVFVFEAQFGKIFKWNAFTLGGLVLGFLFLFLWIGLFVWG